MKWFLRNVQYSAVRAFAAHCIVETGVGKPEVQIMRGVAFLRKNQP